MICLYDCMPSTRLCFEMSQNVKMLDENLRQIIWVRNELVEIILFVFQKDLLI